MSGPTVDPPEIAEWRWVLGDPPAAVEITGIVKVWLGSGDPGALMVICVKT